MGCVSGISVGTEEDGFEDRELGMGKAPAARWGVQDGELGGPKGVSLDQRDA